MRWLTTKAAAALLAAIAGLGDGLTSHGAQAASIGRSSTAATASSSSSSWSLLVGETIPTTGGQSQQRTSPAQLTSLVSAALASSAGCGSKAGAVRYAGQYAVSPPLLNAEHEPASEVVLWYVEHSDEDGVSCASAQDQDSIDHDARLANAGLRLSPLTSPVPAETITSKNANTPTPAHLVFVAQEALDPSLLGEQSNASWTSPMLLQHAVAASASTSAASAEEMAREVKSWTWEQQMRALLGEASVDEKLQGEAPILGSTDSSHHPQAVFAASASSGKTASKGEDVERVTDAHTLHQHVKMLHLGRYWALLEMDDAALLSHELFLPPDSRVALVPSLASAQTPLLQSNEDGKINDNKTDPHFPTPQFSSLLSSILASHQLANDRLQHDARILTAESPNPGWVTRHSGTEGGRKAADWVLAQLSESLAYVAGAECKLWTYHPLYAPNVVCTIRADPEAVEAFKARAGSKKDEQEEEQEGLVLLSAHYDSRGTFGYTEAPGGDDDGSGTTLLLGVARVIGEYRMRFARDVHLVAHSGEEQGLVGSKYYAEHLRKHNATVRLALQADMVAFHQPGEPAQLAFPNRLATDSATKFVQALAQLYTPELVVGYCTACCSDHQSYWEQGYPATWLFERNGAIADYAYHQSYDVTNRTGYDFDQLRGATQVALATVLETAHFYL